MDIGSKTSARSRDLDAEFKKTLCIIKQYIPYINSKDHIYCYRIWLEKLSLVDDSQKQERNAYLNELSRQIQSGVLEAPFTVTPPSGRLPPLQQFQWQCRSAICSEDAIASLNSLNSADPNNFSQALHTPCVYGVEVPEKLDYNYPAPFPQQFFAFPLFYPQQPFTTPVAFDMRKRKQNTTLPTKEATPLVQKFVKKNFRRDDESSWCDVSELSTTSATPYASGDSYKPEVHEGKSLLLDEMTVSKMVGLIKKLQKENQDIYRRILKEGDEVFQKVKEQEGDKTKTNASACDSLCGEVECLRKRLQELQEIKRTLQLQGLRGRDTLDILELELKAAQAKNSELQSSIVMLESKVKESELAKQKEVAVMKKKLADSHHKEIHMLKELHNEEIAKLKNFYEQKCTQIQQEHSVRVEKVKNTYENDIMTLKQSYQTMLERKEEQIRLLEETVQKQCEKMEQEVKFIQDHLKRGGSTADEKCYAEKIRALETCVVKLDRLFRRSEKEYQKQICKLKKKIKLCNKANELLMQSQKLNSLVDDGEEKQKKIDSVVSELENHYKALLDSVLEQTLSTKLKDEELISDLRERLLKPQ